MSWKNRIRGLARVLGVLLLVQSGVGFLWLRSARARTAETLLSVGAELTELAGPRDSSAPRSLFLNGVKIHFRTASTSDDVYAVLDRFHAMCRERTGIEMPAAVEKKLSAQVPKGSSLFDGVIRTESAKEGVVACVDSFGKLSLPELAARLQRFQKSGDLADIGELRYALARRVGDKTSLLMAWTEGSVPVLSMFPTTGDAPGLDLPEVPRAPGTRRLLSTWESGQPYSLAVYAAPGQDLSGLERFYRERLDSGQWAVKVPRTTASLSGRTIIAKRGDHTMMVRLNVRANLEPTVTVVVLG